MGYIVRAIEGMAEACKALDFPVVSGNVSLYNETDGQAIPPTPVVGGIGLIDDVSKIATLKGAQPGDVLILIGETKGHMGASLYAREILGLKGEALGPPPPVDFEAEKRNGDFIRIAIEQGAVNAVHDVSDGGVACALVEMALASGVGFEADLYDIAREDESFPKPYRISQLAFEESTGRYLISAPKDFYEKVNIGRDTHFPTQAIIGKILGRNATFSLTDGEIIVDLPLSALGAAHEGWLPDYMGKVE